MRLEVRDRRRKRLSLTATKIAHRPRQLGPAVAGRSVEADRRISRFEPPLDSMRYDPRVIRPASRSDLLSIRTLINALATYEGVADAAPFELAAIEQHFFGDRPYVEALLAVEGDAAVGLALFCPKYSAALWKPALLVIDLFVLESRRGLWPRADASIGASRLRPRSWARMEWSVLDWNEGASAFYRSLGALAMDDRTTFRLANDAMVALASS